MTNVNNLRACEAAATVQAFLSGGGDQDVSSADPGQTAVAGLIAAIMHLCDAQEWNFTELLADARAAYEEDISGGVKAERSFAQELGGAMTRQSDNPAYGEFANMLGLRLYAVSSGDGSAGARERFSLCVDGHPRKRLPNCPPSVVDPGVCISYGGLEPRPGFERDHIVPLCAGGPDTPDNMLVSAARRGAEEGCPRTAYVRGVM